MSLLAELQSAERKHELVQRFIKEGGVHRLSLSVDHPDPEVKAAIEAIAARNIPAELLLKGFLRFSMDEVNASRDALCCYTNPQPVAAAPKVAA